MAAPTDLTWSQFQEAFSLAFPNSPFSDEGCIRLAPDDTSNVNNSKIFLLNINALVEHTFQSTNDTGVTKALIVMLQIARAAQEKLNEGKPTGERLAAFPAPTIGAQANGFVPISRTIAGRYELASASKIVAVTA